MSSRNSTQWRITSYCTYRSQDRPFIYPFALFATRSTLQAIFYIRALYVPHICTHGYYLCSGISWMDSSHSVPNRYVNCTLIFEYFVQLAIIARPFQRDGTLIAATRQPVTIRANTYSWLSTAGSAARGMGPFSSADQRTSDRPSFVMENYVCLSHGVFAVFRAGNGDITGASCGWENAFDRGSVGLECKGRWSSTCQPCFNRGWRVSLGETDTRVVARRSSGYWLFIVT